MIQAQMLNKILRDKDSSLITLNNLDEYYFSDYKEEFRFIKDHLYIYGNIPDFETFLHKFEDFTVIDVQESSTYLLEELVNDRNKRFLAEGFNKVRKALMDNDVEYANQILNEIQQNQTSCISLQCVDILSDTSRYDAYEERLKNYNNYFIKTGFKELDDIIGGWDVKEELATIVARTGMGKSWMLLKSASEAAKQGKIVGIYSGEMSANKVGYRMDTLIGNISNGALIHGNSSIKNEYKNYLSNLKDKVPGQMWILTPEDLNGPATVSDLRAFVEKYNIEILFIDQHSLLEDQRKAKNPVEKAANISKDLKILQVTKQIPIISVSQQNRTSVEGKDFDTTQLAQSDRIAQDSTVIIFIERDADLFKLHLVKSRDTENGKILSYKVDLNNGRFIFIPNEDSNKESLSSDYDEDEVF